MLEGSGLMVFYENMLALNNVSLTCEDRAIIGVFGPNSAGKSTLMYALSGIMLDIRKKEAMRGGERISLYGSITLRRHRRSRRSRPTGARAWASSSAPSGGGSSRRARSSKT